ncbi:hypothetical protein [Algoriphagus limi]|uniref:Autotransporter translocation and assembly factor TamB n=1 Tax=Algoriphagus limi TaxID=2975273 RepID=A0ABT2G7Q9_9BACT|nr:hypothetical protein [Algoriphagus limi]MCS5491234.1 hypothetical protein [Algoriphagus limi]
MLKGIRDRLTHHPKRKRVLKFVLGFILAIVFLEFLVYFGSNFLLLNWTRSKINEATGGVYEVEFNSLNFSLFRRGVFLSGVVLHPDPQAEANEGQVLFDFQLDELGIRDVWYDWDEKVLVIGDIRLDNPNLSLQLPPGEKEKSEDGEEKEKVSGVKRLENEIKKSIDKLILGGILIEKIEIDDANLFFQNFLSPDAIHAQNTRLHIYNIDWRQNQEWNNPFNAEGFDFELQQVEFSLPDEVHKIFAEDVFISSMEKRILLEEFSLFPNRSIESPAYYELKLEELRVGNVDLNRAFRDSELEIDEIILENPEIQVLHNKAITKELPNLDQPKSGDLNKLIEGILNSIYIKELSVNGGKFLSAGFLDSLENRIEANYFDFKMVEFYLGEDEERKVNQFFYGKDAAMELDDFAMYLSDKYHVIRGSKVTASSFLDRILVEGFELVPRDGVGIEISPNQTINAKLAKLEFEDADLKKLYNEGKLDVEKILLQAPDVELTELRKSEDSKEDSLKQSNLLAGFLSEARIGNFDLQDGKIQFKNASGIRSDDIGFEKFSLNLEQVQVSLDSALKIRDILLAEEMVLSLDQYQLKLRDNLHMFRAGQVVIDSKQDLVEVRDFSLRPESPSSIRQALATYGKSVALDVSVPFFQVKGIDIRAALLEDVLFINEIFIPRPEFTYTQYQKSNVSRSSTSPNTVEDFKELLSAYFHTVSIDSVRFEEGKLNFTDFSGRQEISFSEEDLSLFLKGFYFDPTLEVDSSKTFFSDEIILDLADYSFSLAEGDYDVTTNHLRFNTKNQSLVIDTLKLVPGESLDSKLALSLVLPMVSLEGVDLEEFLFENSLLLDRLVVDGSNINLDIKSEFQKQERQKSERGKTEKPMVSLVQIGEVIASNADFSLAYQKNGQEEQSVRTKFDLGVVDLKLDDQSDIRQDASGLFSNLSISLNDFRFNLPDSVHQIAFSNFDFDSERDETIFSGISINPIDPNNEEKFFIQGKIKELGIKNNELVSIQETGVFDIQNLRISGPDLKLVMNPDAESKTKQNETKPSNTEGLIQSILLRGMDLDNGRIAIHKKNLGPVNGLAFQQVEASVHGLDWNLTQMSDQPILRDLLEGDTRVSFGDYEFFTKDSMESIRVGELVFDGENLEMDMLRFAPTKGRYAYLREKGFQTDAVDLRIDKLRVEGIDFPAYFEENRIVAHKLEGDDFRLDIFRDKRLPILEGVYKPMPQQILQEMSFSLKLDSLLLNRGRVRYQEFTPGSPLPGQISFEEVSASISPIATSKESEEYPLKELDIIANTKLMGEGDVNMQSHLYFEPPYPMDVTIQLGAMSLEPLNNILSKGAFLNAREDAQVVSGDWSFRMDENEAIGNMRFHYENLKVDFLDSMTLEKGTGKLALISFLANTLIKNNNPRKLFGYTVLSDIYVKRDTSKFMFSTWWKATLSGLKGSVGLGQPAIPVRKEEEEKED